MRRNKSNLLIHTNKLDSVNNDTKGELQKLKNERQQSNASTL